MNRGNVVKNIVVDIIYGLYLVGATILVASLSGCSGSMMLPLERGEVVVFYTPVVPQYVINPMFDYSLPLVERVYIYRSEVIVNQPPKPPIIIDKHPDWWRIDYERDKTRDRIREDNRAPRREIRKNILESEKKCKNKDKEEEKHEEEKHEGEKHEGEKEGTKEKARRDR